MIDSDSLVGTNFVNALSGTGVDCAALLFELDPPPPPPPPLPLLLPVELLPFELARVVPLADVVALDPVPVLELVFESSVWFVPEIDADDSAELAFTLAVADAELVFPEDSADVVEEAEFTPFVAEDVSSDRVVAVDELPAPADDPCVFDPPAATVPVVVDCT